MENLDGEDPDEDWEDGDGTIGTFPSGHSDAIHARYKSFGQ